MHKLSITKYEEKKRKALYVERCVHLLCLTI